MSQGRIIRRMAETLRSQGICVIPARFKDKKPILNWKSYQSQQPTDEEFTNWFCNNEKKNLAVVCGEISGNLIVLDFDDMKLYHKAVPSEKKLIETTLVVQTGSGKRHVYFRTTESISSQKFHLNDKAVLEVQSTGTIVIAPGSVHPNGHYYQSLSPSYNIALIDFEELLATIRDNAPELFPSRSTTPHANQSPLEILKALGGVPQGARNNSLFTLAVYLRNHEIPKEITELTIHHVNQKNNPPLGYQDITTIVRSAYSRRPRNTVGSVKVTIAKEEA